MKLNTSSRISKLALLSVVTTLLLGALPLHAQVSGVAPQTFWRETDQALPNGLWRIQFNNNQFNLQMNTDATGAFGSTTTYMAGSNGGVQFITGSVSNPGISFIGDPDTGMFSGGANVLAFTVGGTNMASFLATRVSLGATISLDWNGDTFISRIASGVAALANGSAPQEWRTYGAIAKYMAMSHDGTNGVLGVNSGNLYLQSVGINWILGSDGNFIPENTNVRDLGSVSNSVRAGYFGTNVSVGTTPATAGSLRVPNNSGLQSMNAGGNQNLTLMYADGSNNTVIGNQFGGTHIYGGGSNVIWLNPGAVALTVRMSSDTNNDSFIMDGSSFGGVGAFGFGTSASNASYVRIDPPAFTGGAATNVHLFEVKADNSTTIGTGTSAIVSTAAFQEPNIALGGNAVSDAYTVYIGGAPTEGTRNGALWVASGASRLDGQLLMGTGSNGGGQLVVTGTYSPTNGLPAGMVKVSGTVNAFAGGQPSIWATQGGVIVEAASGNHATVTTAYFGPATVTGGTATVTNTATVYIENAMSATVSGTNNALFVAAGASRFDGAINAGGASPKFTVDTSGNITRINNVATSFPSSNSAGIFINDGSGNLSWAGILLSGNKVTSYNNDATQGIGLTPVALYDRITSNAASIGLATFSVPAGDRSYIVSANVNVTTSTTHSFGVTVTYKDENNTTRVLNLTFSQITGTFVTLITNITGAGAYEGVPLHIRVKGGTNVDIATTGTFTSVAYNLEGSLIQVD